MERLLIVEDNLIEQKIYKTFLGRDFELKFLEGTEGLLETLHSFNPALIILDLHLKTGDGHSAHKKILETDSHTNTPIFFVSASQELADRMNALSCGAVDFVVKPFIPAELKLKINNALSRVKKVSLETATVCVGNLCVNIEKLQLLTKKDSQIEMLSSLSPLEAKLLRFFLKNEGRILSRDQILTAVWGEEVHVVDRVVDTQISSIRKKIHSTGARFESIYGAGYILKIA